MELVIKVKYEDTLRRFTVPFNADGYLNLDLSGLKAKIFNLFKLAPDVDLTITYVDEDSDSVTIVNDVDLHDAVRQCLNPLRITVSLDSYKSGNVDMSRSSTPWSPHNAFAQSHSLPCHYPNFSRQPPFTSGGPVFNDLASKAPPSSELVSSREHLMSKLVIRLAFIVASYAPENYREFFSELSHDMMARTAAPSPDPLINELIDTLSMLDTLVKDHGKMPITSSDNLATSEQCKINSGWNDVKWEGDASNAGNMARRLSHWDSLRVASGSKTLHGSAFFPLGSSNEKIWQKVKDGYHNQDSFRSSTAPLKGGNPAGSVSPPKIKNGATSNMPSGRFYQTPVRNGSGNTGMIFHPGVECDGCGVNPLPGPRYKSKVKNDYDLCSFCVPEEEKKAYYTRMDVPIHYQHTHVGIECNACGLLPITGLRYKSKVKENYDLCSNCFSKVGNEADYTKMSWTTRKCPYLRKEELNRMLLHTPIHPNVVVIDD